MRKTTVLRILSALLATLMLFGGFSVVSFGADDIQNVGELKDILTAIRYEEYLSRHSSDPNNASSTIKIDVIDDFSFDVSSSLNDPNYVKNVLCSPDVLKKFINEDAKVNSTSANLIETLQNIDDFIKNNPSVSSFSLSSPNMSADTISNKIYGDYTEYAHYLQNPDVFHEYDDEKYSATLTEEQEKDLALLNNINTYLKNFTRKYIEVYDGTLPDEYKDELTNSKDGIYLPDHDAAGWKVTIPQGQAGYYTLQIRYYSINEEGSKKTSIERSIYIDGEIPYYEATYVTMTKTYRNYVTDENGNKVYDIMGEGCFMPDINGNEIRPDTELVPCWRTISVQDSTGSYVEPLEFYFTEGEHTLQLYAQRESVIISEINLVPAETLPTYEEYINQYISAGAVDVTEDQIADAAKEHNDKILANLQSAADKYSDRVPSSYIKDKASTTLKYIKLEAEYPSATSDATIYPTNDRTSSVTSPQHPSVQYLNTLGGAGSGDQKKWSAIGQWVRYEITVPESGFYKIATRFSQNTIEGSFVSRTLRVQLASQSQASVPFAEAYRLKFNYSDEWQSSYLTNGDTEFSIYLEKGTNYIEMEANLGDMADIIRRVSASMENINGAYIKFLMLAGSTPDADRDYGFYRRIPDAVLTLSREAKELYAIADEIENMTGATGSHIATLRKVAQLLERMGGDESEIAGNLDNLKSNLGTLGTWVSDAQESPLELDYLMICAGNSKEDKQSTKLPKANATFWQTIVFEVKMFFASFTTNYDTLGLTEKTDDTKSIIVWTTTGRDQANIIRTMINNDFTKNTGVAVNLKLVAGGSLLPSVLAGVGPDVSMGHGSADLINWAIRSALVEVTDMGTEEYCAENGYEYDPQYDAQYITGFSNVIAAFRGEEEDDNVAENAWFSASAIVPITLHEVIDASKYDSLDADLQARYTPYDVKYSSSISLEEYDQLDKYEKKNYTEFKAENGSTRYRFYISEKEYKKLDASEQGEYTREKVEYYEKFSLWSLPQEQTFNMMFYRADIFNELGIEPPKTWDDLYEIIGVLQANNMEVSMPTSLAGFQMFLYQMGGDLYSNGGQTISFDENLSIDAFETMCNFFQVYKFPIAADFSNRFRTGEIPMGIVSYTSYTQLALFATEIKGLWEFIPLPGSVDETTGNINNDSTSGTTGLIMLKGAKDRDMTWDSWKFMSWFTSASAQSNYASEVTAVMGTESKHPTANKKALFELPWTSSERDNLVSQFDNLVGVPEYPGSYIISRYVNFAFLDVYNNNADPVSSIQEYVVTINAELTRKRQEFGLAYKEVSYSNSGAK